MKRVLMVTGLVRPWAISNRAGMIKRHLSREFDVTIVGQQELPKDPLEFHLIHLQTPCVIPAIRGATDDYVNHPCWGFEVISVRSNSAIESLPIIKNARFCVAKNPRLAEYVRQYVSPECQISYTPNGVNERMFFPRPIRIGWCGNHRADSVEYKGVALIREAVDLITRKSRNHLHVEFVMDPGDCPTRILAQAEIAPWYRTLDVYVLASKGEGCSNTVMEALASGLPVITTDTGIAQELKADGCDVRIVERTAEAIRAGILDVIGPRLNSRRVIMDRYRWKLLARNYAELYGGLLQ